MKNRFGSNLSLVIALVLVTLGALTLRLPNLGNRPFHGDEAVHAFKFQELWEKGVYHYDANEYHGPTIYYAALPAVLLHGRRDFASTEEADYRLPIAVLGSAMVLLLIPLADGLGRQPLMWAALFTALSPAFVFYSRYYIQEVPLAFFTLGLLACGWRTLRDGKVGWLIGAGICAGGMIASKETSLLTFLALALSAGLTALWNRYFGTRIGQGSPQITETDSTNGSERLHTLTLKQWFLGIAVALFTASLFVTGHFRNPAGIVDYLRSYTPWLGRAHGTDLHRHPWFYYLQILLWNHPEKHSIWSEALIVVLALIGCLKALLPAPRNEKALGVGRLALDTDPEGLANAPTPQRPTPNVSSLPNAQRPTLLLPFLAFYTLTLTGIYALIPYKTPWCLLSFLDGMILLAGVGVVTLVRAVPILPLRIVATLLLLLITAQLGWQAYGLSFVYQSDETNPYVYAHPVPEVLKLATRVQDLANSYPTHNQMLIKVITKDPYIWPVPWYLRRFPNVGYYAGEIPEDPRAPLVIASPEMETPLTKPLDPTHVMTGFYGLRPGVLLETWVSMDLWKTYLDDRRKARAKAGISDDE